MKCSDFEKNIYLYTELSAEEKKRVDTHVQNCAACSALLEEVKNVQMLIDQMAEEKIFPANAARLTSNIMSAVAVERQSRFSVQSFLFGQAKFALSVLSLVLLVLFAFQFVNDSNKSKTVLNASEGTVILNAKLFRDAFEQHRKAKRELYAECRSPFKSNQYDVQCLKSKMK